MKISINPKINITVWFWTIIIYVFAFERALADTWSVFSYIDELMAIIVTLWIILSLFADNDRITHKEWLVLAGWVLVVVIGIVGNLRSSLLNNKFAIMIDIISMVKVWLGYYVIILTTKKYTFYDKLVVNMARIARVVTVVMLVCLIVSQVADIGMSSGERYGFAAFKFIFNVPGNFSKLFYFTVPLMTADLYYSRSIYKIVMIGLNLLVWISTMRNRAFAFVAIYILMVIYFFVVATKTKKIKMRYIVILVALAVIICWNQVVFYFATDTQARSLLLRYGIVTMQEYFPTGAGFGTYGSDIAATYYSKLYILYGFSDNYGMSQGEEHFLNDNYWPMTLGQFGFFGTLIILIVLFIFMQQVLKEMNNNRYFYLASFAALGFLLLSSAASKSYGEYSSICVFMLLGIFVRRERMKKIVDSETQIDNYG